MFNFLKDKNLSADELAKNYVDLKSKQKDFELQSEAARKNAITLQQRALAGESVTSDLNKAKGQMADISLQLDACLDGLGTLLDRLKIRVIDDLNAQIEGNKNQAIKLEATYNVQMEKLIGAYIRVLLQEREIRNPQPMVDSVALSLADDEKILFRKLWRPEARGNGGDIHTRRMAVIQQNQGLIAQRSNFDADAEARRLIDTVKKQMAADTA